MKKMAWLVIFIFVPVMAAHANIDPASVAGVWLLDGSSDSVAEDSSGNGNDGDIQIATRTDGRFGGGLLFEGDGEVSIPSSKMLQLGDQLTIMAYFNAQALNDWHQLIAKDGEYLLRIDPPGEGGNMSSFMNLGGGWEPRSSAGVPEMNTWTHFAATYSSTDGKLRTYVNGELIGESDRSGDPNPTDNPVTFGHWGGGSRFIGVLDELAIFTAALEASDILDIATNGLQAALGGTSSAEPAGKLASAWGSLKK